jgi:hypothetical protein
VNEPFAVINGDDYYGPSSFKAMADFLLREPETGLEEYAMVGFILRNTLSEHGHVSRGVCGHDEELFLEKIDERVHIRKEGAGAYYLDEKGKKQALRGDEMVSMNLWGFQPGFFDHLEDRFQRFLETSGRDEKAEFFIPTVVDRLMKSKKVQVKILPTGEQWFGVTYREDKEYAMKRIARLIEEGVYPERLWS